jgi:N-carbamoylputrescine amidase
MNATEDVADNVRRACAWIDEAARQKADLVVLPEFFNTFYFFQYRDYDYVRLAERDDGNSMGLVREKARRHGLHVIATNLRRGDARSVLRNRDADRPDGNIIASTARHNPGCYRSLEGNYFRAGTQYPVSMCVVRRLAW